MARPIWIQTTGEAFVGAGLISGVIVAAHSSGTLKLNDSPNSVIGDVVLDTYTFATGSQVVTFPRPIQFQQGLFATIGGTAVSLALIISLDTSGVLA